MKKVILLFIFSFSIGFLQAQEVFFQVGKNLSSYVFSDPGNEVASLSSNVGTAYKIGYSTAKSQDSPFFYDFGVTINEYHAKGYSGKINLDYKTNYLGLFGSIHCAIIKSEFNNLAISTGVSTESIVHGNQSINSTDYNLLKQEEFKGFVLSPKIGLQYTYVINSDLNLLMDYSYSRHWNLSKSGTQKLSIQNHGIHFGLSINMY